MAKIMIGAFVSWELTEEEEVQGCIYTVTQVQVLQNLLAICAHTAIAAELDPAEGEHAEKLYFIRQAETQGQIKLLREIIAKSEYHQTTQANEVETIEHIHPDYNSPFGDEQSI